MPGVRHGGNMEQLFAIGLVIWLNSRDKEEARKRNEREREQEGFRKQLYSRAQELESQFYRVGSIEKQYDCLKSLASTASSLGVIYGNNTWVKIEACCRLLKRNCESGAHDRYWVLADELHKAVQAEIREYERL